MKKNYTILSCITLVDVLPETAQITVTESWDLTDD